MSPSEYQELTEYFIDQLGRHHRDTRTLVEGTFESVRREMESLRSEMRSFVGVSVESLRSEIRLVADGVVTNGRRIEENGRRIDALTDRVGGLEVAVSARFADHEERLGALESP
ncbi:MAG: hypothetical protein AB7T31_12960 [Gemmatimonadales bacterium]